MMRYIFRLFLEKLSNSVYYFVYSYIVLYIYIIESRFGKLFYSPERKVCICRQEREGRKGAELINCSSPV